MYQKEAETSLTHKFPLDKEGLLGAIKDVDLQGIFFGGTQPTHSCFCHLGFQHHFLLRVTYNRWRTGTRKQGHQDPSSSSNIHQEFAKQKLYMPGPLIKVLDLQAVT